MQTLVGIKKVDYISKRTGKPVRGFNLYIEEPMSDCADQKGLYCDHVFVSDAVMSPPWSLVGNHVVFVYNKYGNVIDCKEGGD